MSSTDEDGGLTDDGYWALLRSAGIQKIRLMSDGSTWLARNRNGTLFPVDDPGEIDPHQRRDVADSIIASHEDR
jgi:hypothetical protein